MIQQYLTFEIENTRYAINVFQIQEVLEYQEPQPIPCSSPLLIGIIRSRNTNVAIMSLRKKFGLPNRITDKLTRLIVLEVVNNNEGTINLYGIIADKVHEVIEINDKDLEPMPKANKFAGSEFVTSAILLNDNYTLLLDVNRIFSDEELLKIKESNQNSISSLSENAPMPETSNFSKIEVPTIETKIVEPSVTAEIVAAPEKEPENKIELKIENKEEQKEENVESSKTNIQAESIKPSDKTEVNIQPQKASNNLSDSDLDLKIQEEAKASFDDFLSEIASNGEPNEIDIADKVDSFIPAQSQEKAQPKKTSKRRTK